jgi:G2/mitotic-specific cyclin 3/4
MLLECCHAPRRHHAAVFEKYCDKRYKYAAEFVQTELDKGFTLPHQQPSAPLSHSLSHAVMEDDNLQLQYPRLLVPTES